MRVPPFFIIVGRRVSIGGGVDDREGCCARFSIIELIVVMAIIAILASMLLPVLGQARHSARNINCVGKLRTIGTAWISYTSDYDDYWPDYGDATPDATWYGEGIREKSMNLATADDDFGTFDLRPTMREYLGSTLNSAMICPLASPSWFTETGKYDIDDYGMGGYDSALTSYQLFPNGHAKPKGLDTSAQMRRAGDAFVPSNASGTAYGLDFRLLAADVVWEVSWGLPADGYMLSTQSPYGGGIAEGGNHTNQTTAWLVPPGMDTIANFASDDGSVGTYRNIGANALTSGEWLRTSGGKDSFILPAAAAE